MPTYEYVCKSCGDTIEKVQSFSEKPLRRHEKCGGDLQKVFHARGVVFKGPGFYSTDARASSNSSKRDDGSQSKEGSKEKDGSKARDGSKAKEGSKAKDGSGSSSKETSTSSAPSPAATPSD